MQTFNQIADRDAGSADAFIGACLMSVPYMQSAHFATTSYAQHMAYEEFYKTMPGLVDKFAEVHIAITGRYKPVLKVDNVVDTVEYLRRIVQAADEMYSTQDSALKTVLDEIKTLCYQTIYKLKQFD